MNLLGALILGVSAYWMGIGLSKEEGESIKAMESLISLLNFMKRRITAEKRPLKYIFSGFEDEYLCKKGFLEKICGSQKPIGELWQDACRDLPLSDTALKELCYFGGELGKLNFEEQLLRLDTCVDALKSQLKELRISVPKKQKSIKTICGLCGVLTAILLL